jgi:hypothetical protein
VRITSIVLFAFVSAPASNAQVLRMTEPSAGQLKQGEKAFVDDGSCPLGTIKLVTGTMLPTFFGNKSECVKSPFPYLQRMGRSLQSPRG